MKLRTLPKLFGVLLGVSVSTALLSGCIVASRPAYGYATYLRDLAWRESRHGLTAQNGSMPVSQGAPLS